MPFAEYINGAIKIVPPYILSQETLRCFGDTSNWGLPPKLLVNLIFVLLGAVKYLLSTDLKSSVIYFIKNGLSDRSW